MGYVGIWFLFGIATAFVASNRGANPILWFVFGILLGPVALLLSFLNGARCPACAKKISAKAIICPYCRTAFKATRVVAAESEAPNLASVTPPPLPVAKSSPVINRAVKIVGIAFAGVIVLGLLASLIPKSPRERAFESRLAESVKTDAARAEHISTPILSTGVTKANYDRIRTGMSYLEVVAILGQSGEELSRVELAGTSTVMYSWRKSFSVANMNAMFQNGKLVSKAQFGL
jgi:hypothetical protein